MPSISVLAIACVAGAREAQETLRITDSGVGRVTAQTPFVLSEIQGLFPNYSARANVGMTEGIEIPILEVRDGEDLVLTLTPTLDGVQVFSVIVHRAGSIDAWGGRVGASYSSIYGDQSPERCLPGSEELSGAVLCIAAGAEQVWYVFRGVWAGPDGSIPPPNALAAWTVSEVVWMRQTVQRGCWWSACVM